MEAWYLQITISEETNWMRLWPRESYKGEQLWHWGSMLCFLCFQSQNTYFQLLIRCRQLEKTFAALTTTPPYPPHRPYRPSRRTAFTALAAAPPLPRSPPHCPRRRTATAPGRAIDPLSHLFPCHESGVSPFILFLSHFLSISTILTSQLRFSYE